MCQTCRAFLLACISDRTKAKKAKTSKAKREVDPTTAKLKSATKLVNQRKLLQNLLVDASDKLKAWSVVAVSVSVAGVDD